MNHERRDHNLSTLVFSIVVVIRLFEQAQTNLQSSTMHTGQDLSEQVYQNPVGSGPNSDLVDSSK